MRRPLLAAATLALLATPGCANLFGKAAPVTECRSKSVSATTAVENAPVWVPGSPQRTNLPTTGCIGGDGSHHTDRLCVESKVENIPAIQQAELTARKQSLRLLGEKLETRLAAVLATASPPPQPGAIEALSKQLRDSIGRVTATWQSPNCEMYAIAEIELDDFRFVMEGPALPGPDRDLLVQQAETIVGGP